MTVALAIQRGSTVYMCGDTGTVMGDSIVQADDKVVSIQVDGVPLLVAAGGSGDALRAAERWLATTPPARARDASRGLQRALKALSKISHRYKDDALSILVVGPSDRDTPRIYMIEGGGVLGPTLEASIGTGATPVLVAFHAIVAWEPTGNVALAVETALRACFLRVDGVVGGPGQVWLV